MDLLEGVNYFYTVNGQKIGPVEGTQIIHLAQQGQISATDHIWTDGMVEWIPASSFNQLAPVFPAPNAPTMLQRTGDNTPGLKRVSMANRAGPRTRKTASFAMLMILLVFGGLLVALGFLSTSFIRTDPDTLEVTYPIAMELSMAAVSLGCLFLFGYHILSVIYVYRAWSHIQESGEAPTTPGKAAGFLFIPLFNLFWIFIALGGWPEAFNRYLDLAGADRTQRASKGLAMGHCVCSILGIPFLHPFVMHSMCKGINSIARLPELRIDSNA